MFLYKHNIFSTFNSAIILKTHQAVRFESEFYGMWGKNITRS